VKPRDIIWLLVLLLSAFALRIFQLEIQSIWWDEGISLHLATSEYSEIVKDRLNNIHPPFYFFGLKVWLNMVGLNVFTARYLSLLAGWLQVAAVIGVARRWFGLKTAFAAGILAAVSAVTVIYSQEIRVYSILPLIYLALIAVTRELTRQKHMKMGGTTLLWFYLGLATWLGLHLHYITLVVVIYVSVWALIVFSKNRCWLCVRRWLLVKFLVLLVSLPWFLAVFRNWTTVSAEAQAGTFVTDPVPLQFLLRQVWAFQLTGLAGILARPGVIVFV
jgi:mannosyltransferase